jgi:hypothetical protein
VVEQRSVDQSKSRIRWELALKLNARGVQKMLVDIDANALSRGETKDISQQRGFTATCIKYNVGVRQTTYEAFDKCLGLLLR